VLEDAAQQVPSPLSVLQWAGRPMNGDFPTLHRQHRRMVTWTCSPLSRLFTDPAFSRAKKIARHEASGAPIEDTPPRLPPNWLGHFRRQTRDLGPLRPGAADGGV
jgi:hypothetical protein